MIRRCAPQVVLHLLRRMKHERMHKVGKQNKHDKAEEEIAQDGKVTEPVTLLGPLEFKPIDNSINVNAMDNNAHHECQTVEVLDKGVLCGICLLAKPPDVQRKQYADNVHDEGRADVREPLQKCCMDSRGATGGNWVEDASEKTDSMASKMETWYVYI